MEQKLRVCMDIETRKCTIAALAAGVEWAAQGRPKQCPSRRRIDVMASGIGLGEIVGADQANEHAIGVKTSVAREINSICHDAIDADHERGYQDLRIFLLPTIRSALLSIW